MKSSKSNSKISVTTIFHASSYDVHADVDPYVVSFFSSILTGHVCNHSPTGEDVICQS